MAPVRKPKVGLALGSGAARGWAHIGVIRELTEVGVVPDIVCGCSIGAFVGADMVIAVDLGSDVVGSALKLPAADEESETGWTRRMLSRFGMGQNGAEAVRLPSLVSVLTTSIHIMQVRIARSRLAGEPADVLVTPRLAQLGLMDYHRGMEAIAEGRAAVRRMLPALEAALGAGGVVR